MRVRVKGKEEGIRVTVKVSCERWKASIEERAPVSVEEVIQLRNLRAPRILASRDHRLIKDWRGLTVAMAGANSSRRRAQKD